MWRYLRDPTFSRFDTIPVCDRHTHTQTDRQTDRHTTTAYTALSKASRGKNYAVPSVQPFLHDRCRMHILHIRCTAPPHFRQTFAPSRGERVPYLIHTVNPRAHPTCHPKRHLDRVSRFSRIRGRCQRKSEGQKTVRE